MTRYRAPFNVALATVDHDRGLLNLRFEQPERAVAAGQLVVLYDLDEDEVLGAATIRESS
jgi:tRNA U34 2-thiouridine synthase MnmA/TrmU